VSLWRKDPPPRAVVRELSEAEAEDAAELEVLTHARNVAVLRAETAIYQAIERLANEPVPDVARIEALRAIGDRMPEIVA
jgi:hypothetical protein